MKKLTLEVETKDGRILRGTYPLLHAIARQEVALAGGAKRAELYEPTPHDHRRAHP